MESITNYVPIINNINDIIIPVITIPGIDYLLCYIFGNKARWFQLHSAINAIIVYIIYQDVYNLFIDPIQNVRILNSKIDCNFIILIHLYHIIAFTKITAMDIFHHTAFVAFGAVPIFYLENSNLLRLGCFPICGLPGTIEYFTLSLVKHNKLSSLLQKRLNSYLYNYIRYPLSIYAIVIIYITYLTNPLIYNKPLFILYTILIIFSNGAYYNKLTVENYIGHKSLLSNTLHKLII